MQFTLCSINKRQLGFEDYLGQIPARDVSKFPTCNSLLRNLYFGEFYPKYPQEPYLSLFKYFPNNTGVRKWSYKTQPQKYSSEYIYISYQTFLWFRPSHHWRNLLHFSRRENIVFRSSKSHIYSSFSLSDFCHDKTQKTNSF